MCPPAQLPRYEIGLYWSDEQIISLLANHIPGSDLPDNVLEHSSPFVYPPSNLPVVRHFLNLYIPMHPFSYCVRLNNLRTNNPEGMWFLVHSNEEKESVHGFWKAKGEACNVYSDKVINGWRTTLEYFEGLAPDGQITDWLMQEYKITPKDVNDKYGQKDSLCRVFLCSDNSSKSEMKPENCKITIESKNNNPSKSMKPDTNIASDQDGECESQARKQSEAEAVPVASDAKPNSPLEVFSELECFSRGDFLELDDLEDPESHSSSSRNSSCPSNLSEEYFGSADFLRDLEEEIDNSLKQEQISSSSYKFSTSTMQNDVVLQPPLSGNVTETSSSSSSDADNNTLTDKRAEGQSSKRHNPESKTEGTSDPETSPKNAAAPSDEKKAGSSRMKKFRTYFCFATF